MVKFIVSQLTHQKPWHEKKSSMIDYRAFFERFICTAKVSVGKYEHER